MNTRRVNTVADAICRAQENGTVTPAGIAMALEGMGLLQSPESAAELESLRARVAELEAQRDRRRDRLVALQNDAMDMRGSLSPNGEKRKVPFPLGETLTPAVDWLIARIAELEAERHTTNEALDDAVKALRADRDRIAELDAHAQAEEKLRPHREMIANSNLHYIGKLELRIRRARTLHLNHPDPGRCQHDGEAWPCPTTAALEAAVGEAVHPCGCPKRFGRHAEGCPTQASREADASGKDTLAAWLYQRFMPGGVGWDHLDSGQREYWEHEARAVRRAVERGGFKAPSAPAVAARPLEDPHDSPLHHAYLKGRDLPETGGAS